MLTLAATDDAIAYFFDASVELVVRTLRTALVVVPAVTLVLRWNTYKTPLDGVFLASAATPPGPAVHGMCGDNAARTALREVFGIREKPPLRRPVDPVPHG